MAAQAPFQAEALNIQRLQAMSDAFAAGQAGAQGQIGTDPRQWIQNYIARTAGPATNPFLTQLEQATPSPLVEAERALQLREAARERMPFPTREPLAVADLLQPTTTERQTFFPQGSRTQILSSQLEQKEKEFSDALKMAREESKALEFITNPNSSQFKDLSPAENRSLTLLGLDVAGRDAEGGLPDQIRSLGGTPQPTPATPAIPDWLARMTGISGRVPETRQEIPTPSGQQFGRLTSSQRQQFAGFQEFAGKAPLADVFDRMAMMRPGTPTGARRARVRPALQR